MLAQGSDGEVLLRIFDKIEALGINTYTDEQLQVMTANYPQAAEYDTAIEFASLCWTTGGSNQCSKVRRT